MSRKKVELLLSVFIVFFFVWVLWEARHWPAQSKLFPWSLGFTFLILALTQVAVAWRATLKESGTGVSQKKAADASTGTSPSVGENLINPQDIARRRIMILCIWIVGFFLGIWLLGFKVGSLCLTFAFLKFTANENWLISAAIGVGSYLFFWLVFDIALKVPLDNGFIADYFSALTLPSP